MINPLPALIVVILMAASGFGGWRAAMDHRDALELERKQGWADALDATAREIAKVKVINKTINTQADTIIKEKTILQECKNPNEMVDLINRAAKGVAK